MNLATFTKNPTKAIATLVVIAFVAYLIYVTFLKKSKRSIFVGGGSGTNAQNSPCDDTTVLKRGDTCEQVLYVQAYFNTFARSEVNLPALVEDSIFGAKTEDAVKAVTGANTTSWNAFKTAVDNL